MDLHVRLFDVTIYCLSLSRYFLFYKYDHTKNHQRFQAYR